MATKGSEILSYTADPRIGLGATKAIPVSTTKDLEIVNRTGQNLMLENMAQNKALFDQKVRDRDKMLQAIDSGDIKVGDLLEEDTPIVKEGLEKLDQAWEDMIKRGVNDLDAQRTYKKALRDAQDRVTQAQGRKLFYDQESQNLSKETLPRKQEARKKNLEGVIKGGFWKDITPYQQTQDLDIPNSILSTAATVTTDYTDPKTLTKGKKTVFDYDKTLQANKTNFLNDTNKRYDQQQLLNSVESLSPQEFKETIDSMNNRIKEYNDTMGKQPGDEGFVEEITYQVDPATNRPMINERATDFAAKYTLANQKPFSSTTEEFDKDRANFELGKERNKIAQANAYANQLRAKTYAALQNKKLSKMTEDEKRVKNFWDGIVGKVKEYKTNFGNMKDFVLSKDLPEGYQYIAGIDKDGKPIKLKPKQANGQSFYDTKYYSLDGNEVNLKKQYDEFIKAGGKGSYEELRTKLLKEGKLTMELEGQNGVGNFETAYQTARALSNKVGSGKEEPVFGEETVETTTEEE